MTYSCPKCGAFFPDDDTCQSIFDALLVLEFTDPGYGEVHFLTVACFMVQHERFSDAGLLWINQTLAAYLEQGLTGEQLRQLAAKDTGNDTRKWKISRLPDAPPLPKVPWSMTIADVALNYKNAQSYRELVKQWAWVTLREMQPILDQIRLP